ncbi:MAG TPA: hypothetical protein VMM12_00725 [Longimicrobiales bacterium]|nr:hypothetical protein [Longimicrobiales bacterium]
MTHEPPPRPRETGVRVARFVTIAGVLAATACGGARAAGDPGLSAEERARNAADTRVGLGAGWLDAEIATMNMELVATQPRPEGFFDEADLGNILLANSDMAYRGTLLFMGSFHGFQIWDIADPSAPRLRTSVVCPGGQGDLSVHGDLLFMSVEMPNGRVDCGTGGQFQPGADPARFRGVRIFDISDIGRPRQVGGVQTCRGSHTHTLVPDRSDASHVYIYVSGTADVRPDAELEGCTALEPTEDTTSSLFRIEVIEVPLAAPQDARIVNMPRIFAVGGEVAGLWPGGAETEGAQTTARTDQCHDITAYPAVGLAAGACSGNGILLDISDPAYPVRVEEVFDPNFAYWHSATFNNDATKVIFTDEWGGGMAARCQSRDRRSWGANAIFELRGRQLRHRSYYKLPAPQTAAENCVAHNGSLVPVPGRDIMVQAWYQGGISVFDFTDPARPHEIAYFDRGPLAEELLLGGVWSAYWYNGRIYGSEIGRGLDVLRLTPSEHLSANELEAADLVRLDTFNPQTQPRLTWPAHPAVARAYLDQLRRDSRIPADRLDDIAAELDRALAASGSSRSAALTRLAGEAEALRSGASAAEARRVEALVETIRGLAADE